MSQFPTQPIQKSDFDQIYAFWQQTCLELYPPEHEQARFDAMLELNPDLCLCIKDSDQNILGTIMGGFDGRTATINRLAISPNHQGQGIGTQLVGQLEDLLRERGVKKIATLIHVKNTRVLPFYQKLGFQEMEYAKTYYKDL